jgi:hypothetical protein
MSLHVGAFSFYLLVLCINPIFEDGYCNTKDGYYASFFVVNILEIIGQAFLALIFFSFSKPNID